MIVKLATQIFSHSVAKGIHLLCHFKILPAKCLPTATYLEKFNDLFDAFNSKGKKSRSTRVYLHPGSKVRNMVSKGKWHIFIFHASWVSNIEVVISLVRDKTTTFPKVKYILTQVSI